MAMLQPVDMAVKANEILARFRPITPKPTLAAAAAAASLVVQAASEGVVAANPPTSAGAEDLAKVAAEGRDVPVERDLLRKLLEPKVISPRAVRPVCSAIHVGCIHRTDATCTAAASKTAVQVEAELEVDALPAVVSDSSNRVRLVNDAYKQMVGQPECPWLDAVSATSRRISGEVALVVADQSSLPETYGAFTCTAEIEWEDDGKLTSIAVPCDVSRLHCESRDYLFTWRFRTADADASVGHSSEEISES